jgi:hypothetical protein
MSINLEAFEWLRKRTYAHARTCGESGREVNTLQAWCIQQLQAWLARHPERDEMSASQVVATSRSVARYVSEKYQPHRAPPKTTRDQRLAERRLSTWVVDELKERGLRPTIRNVARTMGVSKSKAGRLLSQEDVAPVRKQRKVPLGPVTRQVLASFEAMLPKEGSTVVSVDDLAGRVWAKSSNEATGRQHRKRIKDALSRIENARLGFNIVTSSTLAAVRRGRRWKSGEADAALSAAEARPSLVYPIEVLPKRPVGGAFWTSPEVNDVVIMLRVAAQERLPYPDLARFIHAHRLVIDPQPLLDIAWRFSQPEYSHDEMLEQMRRRASQLVDPRWNAGRRYLSKPLLRLVNSIHSLTEEGYWRRPAPDALDTALRVTQYLDHVDDDACNRIDAFRAIIGALWESDRRMDPEAAVAACRQLARAEEAGQWTPDDGHLLRPEPMYGKVLEAQDDIPF